MFDYLTSIQRSKTSLTSRNSRKTTGTDLGAGAGDDVAVNNSIIDTNRTLSVGPLEVPKPKRRCLRLDIGHSRDVFITTFYRIWMYRRRHFPLTLFQILIPPMILIGMTAYLGTLLQKHTKGWSDYPSYDETELQGKICGSACTTGTSGMGVIALFMKNDKSKFATDFKTKFKSRLMKLNIDLKEVHSEEDMLRTAISYEFKGEHQKFIAGIEIDNTATDEIRDDFKLHFTVAMAHIVPGFTFEPAPVFFDVDRNNPKYYSQLLGIEVAVCRTFYDVLKNVPTTVPSILPLVPLRIEVQSMSYPPHSAYTLKKWQNDTSINNEPELEFDEYQGIDSMLATIFVLSMVPILFTMIEGPVTEKENGFKLYLQLMGFPRAAYWFHWILNQMMVQFVTITIQVILIFVPFNPNTGPLVRYGDATLWFMVLVLYNLSCLSFFTFLASFFRRGKIATYIGILLWLLSYHLLQSHLFDFNSSFSLFMLSCLIPSGCIHWAVYIFTTANAITWEISVNFSLTQKSGFKLADVMIMMILNFFIYFFLTLYVDNLNPGPLELGQPWNYFFESIRCRFIDPNKEIGKIQFRSVTDIHWNKHTPVIEFKLVSKKFYLIDGMYGIEDVQFTVMPSSITVLLGHKDSGKTTLMRLLCGAYAPTSGTVIVFDYNVRKDTQKVQSFLNICMQNDMLCEYLTVMEHMNLIAKLKSVSRKDAKEKCKNILESVGLLSQRDDMMWRLAKWQRRILCVAMALIGDVPILILDGPTLGLDLDAKRQIWGILRQLKSEGKTIVMSTKDIEEANLIADRIVLMSRGRVAGVGPPAKLENIFETGYHLKLETTPDANTEDILKFLKQHIPSAREIEGGLKRVRRAMEVQNWDQQNQSQMVIGSLGGRKGGSNNTIIHMPSIFNDTRTKSASSATPTGISRLRSTGGSYISELSVFGMEIAYLLPARERASFPSLFRELDDGKTGTQFGILSYDLKWHSIENAFDEVDDYVDVIDASRSATDVYFDDYLDFRTKALRIFVDESSQTSMPQHKLNYDKKCCSCFRGLYAIIIKRLYHTYGNYRHALWQLLAPIIFLLITIKATNVHFSDHLLSTEISYSASTRITAPEVPYRIAPGDIEAEKFFKSFKKITEGAPNNIKKLKNIGTTEFKEIYNEKNWHKLHDEVVIAADLTRVKTEKTVTALFSPGHHHSAPLSLLIMFNSLLKYEFPGKNYEITMAGRSMLHNRQYSILVDSIKNARSIINEDVEITITVSLAFGCFIFASGFVTQPCSEKLCKLKRYQMYHLEWNGLYWIAFTIVDGFFNILVTIMLTLIIYYYPEHRLFKNPEFIILFVITGLLGGFGTIVASYYWSHHWLRKSTSFYATLSVNQIFGLFNFLSYTIINFDKVGGYAGLVVAFCLQVIQPFCVPWNFHASILWALLNGRCRALNHLVKDELCSNSNSYQFIKDLDSAKEECCVKQKGLNKWSFDFLFHNAHENVVTPLWSNIVFLFAHCVFCILILMSIESRRLRRNPLHTIPKGEQPPALLNPKDGQSIIHEEMFVREQAQKLEKSERDKLFIVENLSTSVEHRNLLHPMTFAVEPGKCTVVVGPETSGITTLYQILAGLRSISEGNVSYGGYSLFAWGTRRKFLQQLGLCPSHDAVLDKLTGDCLLRLFGRLRGIPSDQLSSHVDYWVERLHLQKKIKKQCGSYSAVMKRKLSIACAVIGSPNVLICDEPTKDLDPVSKSEVCSVISSMISANKVVIILTHDLASVKHLCSKLIILVNGQMQFCEATENIYEEIAEEFTLTIKLRGDEQGRIDFKSFTDFISEIENEIESMTLQEEQSHLLMYRIKNAKYNWADLFETIENVVSKHEKVVLDYDIRRTSLEDVYHSYSEKQRFFRTTKSAWDEFRTTYC